MSRPKRDIWQQLVDEAGEKEIEAAARVSVEQAEAELTAAGFDVPAERAKAAAFLDDLARAPTAAGLLPGRAVQKQAPRAKAPERPRKKRIPPAVAWLAAATVTVGAGGLLYVATHPSPPERIGPVPPTTAPPHEPADLVAAAELRRKAGAACDAQDWDACLQWLQRARELDPAGDDAPPVQQMRAKATGGRDGSQYKKP